MAPLSQKLSAVLDCKLIILQLAGEMQITIYTDGACDIHAENRPGGWAAILRAVDEAGALAKETEVSGGAENTTNNQMELRAVIEGLKQLTRPTQLTIVSDSRYVIGVSTRKKKIVKNSSLWQEYFRVADGHAIEWRFVAGHSGNELNERCDRLAVQEKNRRAQPRNERPEAPVALEKGATGIFLSTRYAAKDKTTSWAAIVVASGEERELSGRLEKTSELKGALVGAIKSLERLPEAQSIILFTAQEYLSKGMNLWLAGWIAKGWKTRGGERVKYRQHWERLNDLRSGRQVRFQFIKARDDNPYFQRGKELAMEILNNAC